MSVSIRCFRAGRSFEAYEKILPSYKLWSRQPVANRIASDRMRLDSGQGHPRRPAPLYPWTWRRDFNDNPSAETRRRPA